MKIFVKHTTGIILSIEAESTDTIKSVKQLLRSEKGIPADELQLVFEGLYLKDDFSMKDYNIQDGDTLTSEYVPGGSINILIVNPHTVVFSFNVKITNTIESVKDRIREKMGLPVAEQDLFFNKLRLEDSCTLEHYHITDKSTLDFVYYDRGYINVYIRDDGKKILTLSVKFSDSVKSVKQQIQNKKGIPTNQQYLTFQGKYLQDDSILQDCDILGESNLDFVHLIDGDMKIYIRRFGKEFLSLNVNIMDTVISLKQRIQVKKGITTDIQHLIFEGIYLEDNYKLCDLNIKEESAVDLTLPLCNLS